MVHQVIDKQEAIQALTSQSQKRYHQFIKHIADNDYLLTCFEFLPLFVPVFIALI